MTKIKRLRRKADKIWYQILIEDNPRCLVCGQQAIQIHHFFPKGRFSILRYELENGIPICQRCHFEHHSRGNPIIHQKIIQKKGKDWYNRLLKKSKKLSPSYKGVKYYQDIIKKLSPGEELDKH